VERVMQYLARSVIGGNGGKQDDYGLYTSTDDISSEPR
jgi:hypothetical protein